MTIGILGNLKRRVKAWKKVWKLLWRWIALSSINSMFPNTWGSRRAGGSQRTTISTDRLYRDNEPPQHTVTPAVCRLFWDLTGSASTSLKSLKTSPSLHKRVGKQSNWESSAVHFGPVYSFVLFKHMWPGASVTWWVTLDSRWTGRGQPSQLQVPNCQSKTRVSF